MAGFLSIQTRLRRLSLTVFKTVALLLLAGPVQADVSQKQIHHEMLGNSRANVDFSLGNYESARLLWLSLAEMGNAQAMYSLGMMYQQGVGVAEDPAQAFVWFRRAGEQGEPRALYEVSRCWRDACSGTASDELAQAFLRRAAFSGVPEAQYEWGQWLMQEGQQSKAHYWLQMASDGNLTAADGLLKQIDVAGSRGVLTPPRRGDAVYLFLEEMDGALNSRDLEIFRMLFTEQPVIKLRLPGAAGFSEVSLDELLNLWQQTFDGADRLRIHRGLVDTRSTNGAAEISSELHHYQATADVAMRSTMRETIRLQRTPYGMRVGEMELAVELVDQPLLSP